MTVYFQTAFEESPIGIGFSRLDGQVLTVNQAACDMSGYTCEEFRALNLSQLFFHPEDQERLSALRQRNGAVTDHVVRLKRKDGTPFFTRMNLRVVDLGGRPLIMTVAEDVTDARHAQQAVERSQRARLALARCIQVVVQARDEESLLRKVCDLLIEVGKYRLAWMGIPQHDARRSVKVLARAGSGQDYLDEIQITWAEDEHGQGPTGRAIRLGRPFVVRHVAVDPDFAPWRLAALDRNFNSSCSIPLKQEKEILGAINLYSEEPDAFDVDELDLLQELASEVSLGMLALRRQQDLRKEQDKARTCLDVAGVMLVALDRDGRVSMINRRGCELLGYSEDEILGKDWFAHFIPAHLRARVQQVFTGLISGEHPLTKEFENPILTKDGQERMIAWRNTLLTDADGRIVNTLSSGEDITERKKMEAQIIQADRLASVGLLASGVAHEINNPLTFVFHYLDMLREDLPVLFGAIERLREFATKNAGPGMAEQLLGDARRLTGPRPEDDLLEAVQSSTSGLKRVRDIVRDLKTFSRTTEDDRADIALHEVVESAINLTFNEIKYRATLVRNFAPAIHVFASEGRLCQVFVNLLINAAQAIEEGDARNNRIEVRTRLEGDQAVASVSDTGCGIGPEQQKHLFDPFYTTRSVNGGFGLGLSICQDIVSSLGGRIAVDSQPGQGSRFSVFLPLIPAASQIDEPGRTETTATGATAPSARLLVIDDEPEIGKALQRMLRRHHQVTPVTSAREAIALIESGTPFDGLICDLMMPEMNGMDFHAWLHQHHPRLAEKTIFITGSAFTPVAGDFTRRTTNPILEKPLSVDTLRATIRQLVQADDQVE